MRRVCLGLFMMITMTVFFFSTCDSKIEAADITHAAIIIDDFGGEVKGVDSFLNSNIPITVAIMPFLEQSEEQAKRAHAAGFEIIIHLPMEPRQGKASWLGPNAITSDLSNDEVRRRVIQAIENVPHAKGINNHMGSKIVEDERIIRVVLEVAKEHGLYVIDSGTSSKSVIPELSSEMNIPTSSRDIFLDDTLSSRQYVTKQMMALLKMAQKNGQAIAIGHVGIKGEETFAGISNALKQFKDNNVEIVPMSYLFNTSVEKDHSRFWQPN
ncbi:divergent polysaccharide deacetylase family protein [Bacillus suaedae]|uniref:Divergent polysaccharide deacetylase family protein n=1 Tax=Halalkalibacter suaedae TaxID=2822140 RepID=A0A940WRJ1_9BACI|nr:divergent polysaccharide deacetylase family protein [Bacillus suaedae]MBP3951185.1 divergent polysaccharide deacetylase family protein [Bacillus suaedae]